MKAKRDAGVDPSDPEVRALTERWTSLTERTIAGFTGGDPGIASSAGRIYQGKVRRTAPVARSTPTCSDT